MAPAQSPYDRYSKEEFARRGDELYERAVRPRVGPDDAGKFVAIDIETGDFEVGADELTTLDRLAARHPDAGVWLRRIERPATYRLGTGRGRPGS